MRGARSAKWVAGAIVVAMAATACGSDDGGNGGDGGGAAGDVNPDGVLVVDLGEPQNPLIPTDTNEVYGSTVLDQLFSNLVDFDDDGELVHVAAESIEPNDDASEWTVTLNEGWTFHDGTDVTADNYVDAWNWAADPANGQKNGYWFEDIEGYGDGETMSGLEVVDETTFTVTLEEPVSYFNYKLAYTPFVPYPDSFFEDPEEFGSNPVGQGPYKFVSWDHNESIVLERNDDYAGDNKAQNGGVTFAMYTDPNAAYQDLVSGNVDVLRQVDPQNLPVYEDDLGDRAIAQPYNAMQSIVPVWYSEDWEDTDPRVLQGISMAIDRESITETILFGSRVPADSFVPPNVRGYEAGIGGEIMEYNPERAKELIEEAGGVPDNEIHIQYNSDGGHQDWVEAVCSDIENNTGITCLTDPKPDFATDLDARDAKEVKSMYRGGWIMDYALNVSFMKELYGTNSSANTGFFSDEEVDRLFSEGDSAATVEETVAAYQEAERVLFEKMPAIPLWSYNVNAGHSEKVTNVNFDTFGKPLITEIQVVD
ncbi:ABC transporter substrate-binding protein [Streptomyces sodiiphilus]|uniref:ABC transporter substrate-binding protein n=1 Tax=Streptomyces sodiiphilus TaxID=226217 RepID=A0ABN2NVN4_9ACTN